MARVVGKDASRVLRCTCGGCASVIEYESRERQERKHTDYKGDTDAWNVVVCPNCQEDIRVP